MTLVSAKCLPKAGPHRSPKDRASSMLEVAKEKTMAPAAADFKFQTINGTYNCKFYSYSPVEEFWVIHCIFFVSILYMVRLVNSSVSSNHRTTLHCSNVWNLSKHVSPKMFWCMALTLKNPKRASVCCLFNFYHLSCFNLYVSFEYIYFFNIYIKRICISTMHNIWTQVYR